MVWGSWLRGAVFFTAGGGTVGAGGGSVAWFDPGGKLRNGPRSMGATPGPACYRKGGDEPTNTDAHVVLGNLRPGAMLGGAMDIAPELAERVIEVLKAFPHMHIHQLLMD